MQPECPLGAHRLLRTALQPRAVIGGREARGNFGVEPEGAGINIGAINIDPSTIFLPSESLSTSPSGQTFDIGLSSSLFVLPVFI